MTTKRPAAIYVRVSTEEQATEGFSIQAQISDLERYAQQNNFEIVSRYVDEGFSGKSIEGRPQMKRLLRDAEKHSFEAILIYKTDRLSRNTKNSIEIAESLKKNDIRLLSITENIDLTDHMGMALFQIISTMNELERNKTVERVKWGMTERAKQGQYNGGIVLGYDAIDKKLIVNEDEARIVQTIFNYAEQGLGLKAITRRLNEAGFRTKKKNPFSTHSVKNILNNPVYIGKIRFNQVKDWAEKRRKGKNDDYILSDGHHAPIISMEQWETVQRLIKKRSYTPVRSETPTLLGGILRCPMCGKGMVIGHSAGSHAKYRIYKCGQFHNKGASVCRSNTIRAEIAEKTVFEELTRIVTDDSFLKKLVEKVNYERQNKEQPLLEEKKQVEKRIGKIQIKMKNLKEKILSHDDLIDLFKPELLELQEELKKLQQQRDELSLEFSKEDTDPVDHDSLKKLLSDFHRMLSSVSPEEQRNLLRLIINDIQITKDAPPRVGRRITRINLIFDFTIESLHEQAYSLLPKVYPDYDFVEVFNPRLLDGVTLANFNKSKLGEVMTSLSILPLASIRFPPHNLHHPIHLLHQHQPQKLVRIGEAAKRDLQVGTLKDFIGQP